MKKNGILITALLVFGSFFTYAQETEPDPEVLKAKEETVVVYDLGRFFGYVYTMVQETPKLALTSEQLNTFYKFIKEIESTERIEADWAEETLELLELDVLSPDQLIAVDLLAIAREETRTAPTEQKSGTGSGPIQSYINGGAFNPIIDKTKSIGEGFYELYDYISSKLD